MASESHADQQELFSLPEPAVHRFPVSTGPGIGERNAAAEAAIAAARETDSAFADLGGRLPQGRDSDSGSDSELRTYSGYRDNPNITPLDRPRRSGIGPQYGEDALPHIDQRLDAEAAKRHERGMRQIRGVLQQRLADKALSAPDGGIRLVARSGKNGNASLS